MYKIIIVACLTSFSAFAQTNEEIIKQIKDATPNIILKIQAENLKEYNDFLKLNDFKLKNFQFKTIRWGDYLEIFSTDINGTNVINKTEISINLNVYPFVYLAKGNLANINTTKTYYLSYSIGSIPTTWQEGNTWSKSANIKNIFLNVESSGIRYISEDVSSYNERYNTKSDIYKLNFNENKTMEDACKIIKQTKFKVDKTYSSQRDDYIVFSKVPYESNYNSTNFLTDIDIDDPCQRDLTGGPTFNNPPENIKMEIAVPTEYGDTYYKQVLQSIKDGYDSKFDKH